MVGYNGLAACEKIFEASQEALEIGVLCINKHINQAFSKYGKFKKERIAFCGVIFAML